MRDGLAVSLGSRFRGDERSVRRWRLPHSACAFRRVPPPPSRPTRCCTDPALEARARALSAELRCMVCQNQSIDDSDAPLARDLRVLLRERIAAGDSDAGGDRLPRRPLRRVHSAEAALQRRHGASLGAPPAVLADRRGAIAVVAYRRRRSASGSARLPWTTPKTARLQRELFGEAGLRAHCSEAGFARSAEHYRSLMALTVRRKVAASHILRMGAARNFAWRRRHLSRPRRHLEMNDQKSIPAANAAVRSNRALLGTALALVLGGALVGEARSFRSRLGVLPMRFASRASSRSASPTSSTRSARRSSASASSTPPTTT